MDTSVVLQQISQGVEHENFSPFRYMDTTIYVMLYATYACLLV